MGGKKRYYVVWAGHNPGVYDDWNDAKEQIENFPSPRYKGFDSPQAAAEAFRRGCVKNEKIELGRIVGKAAAQSLPRPGQPDYLTNPEVDPDGWAVDASCLGNPGVMEYQGVELMSGKVIFRVGPFQDATNNIGEFLAIVHALALMQQRGEWHTVYSDSVSGMAWVRNRKVKTQLAPTPRNGKVFDLMRRAISWLNTHTYPCRIVKWPTEVWGEIPADFGRKSKKR